MTKDRMIHMIKAAGATVLTAVLLLFVLSFVALATDDPDGTVVILGPLILILSAGVCGAVSAIWERQSEQPFRLCGLAAGVIFMLLCALTAVFFAGEEQSPKWLFYPLIPAVAFFVQLGLSSLGGKTKRVSSAKKRRNTLKRLAGKRH